VVENLGGDVTQLLSAMGAGEGRAAAELLPLVYDELRMLAERNLRHERPDHTLQATALVHEAYMRLVDSDRIRLRSRAHFYALAAQAMRRILVDHARHHKRQKRGGNAVRISLDDLPTLEVTTNVNLLALDDAMYGLEQVEPRYARIVEMRFFGGMTMEEISAMLDVSLSTVERDWRVARAWLYRDLGRGEDEPDRMETESHA